MFFFIRVIAMRPSAPEKNYKESNLAKELTAVTLLFHCGHFFKTPQ